MLDSKLIKVDDGCFVSGQITADEVAKLVAFGVRLLVNNRPDHEDFDQPTSDETAAAAAAAGLTYRHLPMGALSRSLIEDARTAMTAGGPALLYCRSGMRSALLWAAVRVSEGMAVETALAATANAGFDFRQYRTMLAALAGDARTS